MVGSDWAARENDDAIVTTRIGNMSSSNFTMLLRLE
jgi:hypothetical protein